MINVITKLNPEIKPISDFESFFNDNILPGDLGSIELDVLKKIDSACLLDKDTGAISTRFGITDIYHLSTGCKVVLSYLYLKKTEKYANKVLDVTECGANALNVLFDCASTLGDSDTVFLLRHADNLLICDVKQYTVNGIDTQSLWEGVFRSEPTI